MDAADKNGQTVLLITSLTETLKSQSYSFITESIRILLTSTARRHCSLHHIMDTSKLQDYSLFTELI